MKRKRKRRKLLEICSDPTLGNTKKKKKKKNPSTFQRYISIDSGENKTKQKTKEKEN